MFRNSGEPSNSDDKSTGGLTVDLETSTKKVDKPFTKIVTSLEFFGEVHNHTGIITGTKTSVSNANYFSPGPKKLQPPAGYRDPDELSTQLEIIGKNVRAAVYTGMEFRKAEEELQHPHEHVEIPVTEEQFQKAHAFAKQKKKEAKEGKVAYSALNILPGAGNCANFHDDLLKTIADPHDPVEQHIVNSQKVYENVVRWPANSASRAKEMKVYRESPPELRRQRQQEILSAKENETGQVKILNAYQKSHQEKLERFGIRTDKAAEQKPVSTKGSNVGSSFSFFPIIDVTKVVTTMTESFKASQDEKRDRFGFGQKK